MTAPIMKTLFSFLFCFIIFYSSTAQINFKKLKEKATEKINAQSKTSKGDKLKKFRADQLKKDTLFYNYIFSQGNRASFFANRESKENVLLTFGKNYEDEAIDKEQLEIYEQVFDLNRTAEYSIYVEPRIATAKFIEAIAMMTNGESILWASLNEDMVIREMVNLDTMSVPEKYALGKTIANTAIMMHAEGRHEVAEALIDESINYFKQVIGKESAGLASLYNNKAVIAQSQGKYTQADQFFSLAENIINTNDKKESLSHAILISNQALLYNEIGQYKNAKSSMSKAIKMAQGSLRDKGRDNMSFKINEGLIQYSSGDYELAEQTFNEVLELKRKRMAKNQTDYANVENYLAGVLMESGKVNEVPELLNDALRIFEQKYNNSHPAYIKTQHNLGKYHLYAGQYEKAESLLNEVSNTYLQNYGVYHPDYLNSLEDLAVVAWKKGDHTSAKDQFRTVISTNLELVEKYFGAMSEHEKGQYWAKIRPSILKFYNYASAMGAQDEQLLTEMYDLHLKTKGILLSSSTKIREEILKSDNEELKKTFEQWRKTKEDLLLYYTYSKSQLSEQGINLQEVEGTANRLEKKLSALSAVFAQANKLPTATMAQVKSKLKPGEAAIEMISYAVFDKSFTNQKVYTALIVGTKSLHPQHITLSNGNELDTKYANGYRNTIKLKMDDRYSYNQYWKPVQDQLTGISKIHFSPDGIYYQMNIGALKKADNSYVSDELRIELHSSTRNLLEKKAVAFRSKQAAFFGFPDYGNKGLLTALPGTKKEIERVSAITKSKGYSTKTYLAKEASENNFKALSSPTLLHIATHGFFLKESQSTGEHVFGIEVSQAKENPLLRSGLMLTNAEKSMGSSITKSKEVASTDNGILTAYEVLTLDLKNTDLVVLSACETGLGEIKSGEGVYGLQRAFQIAGAGSVMMSLWKVSDEATQKLMTSFYTQWMRGLSKEAAFAYAQKELRKEFPEPYFWGAFVLLN